MDKYKQLKKIIESVKYGKVSIHLQDGNINHIKKEESIKLKGDDKKWTFIL